VVNVVTAFLVSGNNTILVVLEGATASVDCDRHWVRCELIFDALETILSLDFAPIFDLTNDLRRLMIALSLDSRRSRSVRVVRIQHHTMVVLKPPACGHPATFTATKAIVLAEQRKVVVVVFEGAIDEMLLGEADRRRVIPFGDVAL